MRILSLNHPGFMKELYTRNYIINQCHPNIYNLKNQWEKVKFKSNRNEIQLKICGKNSFVDYQNVTFLNCSYKKIYILRNISLCIVTYYIWWKCQNWLKFTKISYINIVWSFIKIPYKLLPLKDAITPYLK